MAAVPQTNGAGEGHHLPALSKTVDEFLRHDYDYIVSFDLEGYL